MVLFALQDCLQQILIDSGNVSIENDDISVKLLRKCVLSKVYSMSGAKLTRRAKCMC
jgi:hypothetical protein